jgi:hypothetical protein
VVPATSCCSSATGGGFGYCVITSPLFTLFARSLQYDFAGKLLGSDELIAVTLQRELKVHRQNSQGHHLCHQWLGKDTANGLAG